MFDISTFEFLTIALIALIVFGPQRLPEIARKLGSYLREIRQAASELTAGLDREVQQLQQPIKDLKEDLTKPISEIKDTLDETAKSIQQPLREVGDELRKPISPGGPADQPGAGDSHEPPPLAEDEPPRARWVGDDPEVGVSPADAWKGVTDPVPPGSQDPPPTEEAGEDPGDPDGEAEAESA